MISLADFEQHIDDKKAARVYYEAAMAAQARAGTDPQTLALKVEPRDDGVHLLVSGVKDGETYDWADLYEQ